MDTDSADIAIYQMLHERTISRIAEATSKAQRFVHYSTAEAAMRMISGQSVWMRQAICMNDFMEIEYGFNQLHQAYSSPLGSSLKSILNDLSDGLSGEIETSFNNCLLNVRQGDVYLTCISEHYNHEDINGRLSMWRAYGGDSGVAVVMKGAPFLTPSNALGAYTYPVFYDDALAFKRNFEQLVQAVKENRDFLRALPRQKVAKHFALLFEIMILTTKHPGFSEEQEWRVVYAPHLFDSSRLIRKIECVGGVPQSIAAIPLKDVPEEGFVGAEVGSLIDRIIIGPAKFPVTMRDAFVRLLLAAGGADAHSKVWISEIPLRK